MHKQFDDGIIPLTTVHTTYLHDVSLGVVAVLRPSPPRPLRLSPARVVTVHVHPLGGHGGGGDGDVASEAADEAAAAHGRGRGRREDDLVLSVPDHAVEVAAFLETKL